MRQKLLLILVAGALLSACSSNQTANESETKKVDGNPAVVSVENSFGYAAQGWKEIKDNK